MQQTNKEYEDNDTQIDLALDSKAGTGLAIPVNPKTEYATIHTYTWVALVTNS